MHGATSVLCYMQCSTLYRSKHLLFSQTLLRHATADLASLYQNVPYNGFYQQHTQASAHTSQDRVVSPNHQVLSLYCCNTIQAIFISNDRG